MKRRREKTSDFRWKKERKKEFLKKKNYKTTRNAVIQFLKSGNELWGGKYSYYRRGFKDNRFPSVAFSLFLWCFFLVLLFFFFISLSRYNDRN